MQVYVGDKITCRQPISANYSSYAGNPRCVFEPGMTGKIVKINVPAVHGPYKYFHIAEFEGPPMRDKTTTWRVSLHSDNIIKVR